MEEAWKQHTTPPDEQQGADAASDGTSDDTMRQQAKAGPGPLPDGPALPEDAAAPHQAAGDVPTVTTDPAVELPPEADEPTRLPGAAVPQDAPGDVPNEQQPSAAADDAGAAEVSTVSLAAAPAVSKSDVHRQPAAADFPGEPADASVGMPLPADPAASEAPAGIADKGEPESAAPPVLRLDDQLGRPAAAGGAEQPAAEGSRLQPDAAGDPPGAAAAGATAGAGSADGFSDGTLGLQPEAREADGQPDAKDPDSNPADGSPGAAEEAATDGATAAPNAEPAADPPSADDAEDGGAAGASGSKQAVPHMHTPVDEAEQPSASFADLPVRTQVKSPCSCRL